MNKFHQQINDKNNNTIKRFNVIKKVKETSFTIWVKLEFQLKKLIKSFKSKLGF